MAMGAFPKQTHLLQRYEDRGLEGDQHMSVGEHLELEG